MGMMTMEGTGLTRRRRVPRGRGCGRGTFSVLGDAVRWGGEDVELDWIGSE